MRLRRSKIPDHVPGCSRDQAYFVVDENPHLLAADNTVDLDEFKHYFNLRATRHRVAEQKLVFGAGRETVPEKGKRSIIAAPLAAPGADTSDGDDFYDDLMAGDARSSSASRAHGATGTNSPAARKSSTSDVQANYLARAAAEQMSEIRLRKEVALATKAEIKTAQEAGDLVSKKAAINAGVMVMNEVKNRLEALPSFVASDLVGLSVADIESRLAKEIKLVLKDLAQMGRLF